MHIQGNFMNGKCASIAEKMTPKKSKTPAVMLFLAHLQLNE